ncbi:MAG: hypothetical protein NTZ19_13885 [Bacteroidetes bacterium]|nr:hypothetical protein [Bacteroidota bacterium]
MEMQEYIPIELFCRQHGVEVTVISSLQEYGLIEILKINETQCLQSNQLAEAEAIVRLYRELDINPEGIDAIMNLLQRIKEMHSQIQHLKNRLRLYEDDCI